MSKKLLITSTDLMMVQFLIPHVIHLSENGYIVDIACSEVGGRMTEIRQKLKDHVNTIHVVRLVRSPAAPKNILGYKDMKKVLKRECYDIIWTNEPVMGVATRLAARKTRKNGTKVVYMVHGFHFYKGAPSKYWLVFYPIEKVMSRFADWIVTINKEDYEIAKKMHARHVGYIHGIGVDTQRLQKAEKRCDIYDELHIEKGSFLILSVGELNANKNHKVIIQAMSKLNDSSIHYIICGKGEELENLTSLAKELHLEKNVHFLGYRKDVVDICSQVDLFAFPSHREGLGLASLEAMYCGLPLVTSNVRGPSDYMENNVTGYMCPADDDDSFAEVIRILKSDEKLRENCGENSRQRVIPFCLENVKEEVLKLFEGI